MGPSDGSTPGPLEPASAGKPEMASKCAAPGALDPVDWPELRRRMVGLAVRLIWNRDDAEEIVQEALRLLIERSTREAIERRDAWLMRTVSRLCLNHRRRRPIAALDEAAVTCAGEAPGAAAVRMEALNRTRTAIELLPQQQRLALVLRTMEGLSFDEAAEVMELSPGAVRTHVHLARRRLAELLDEAEPESAEGRA